MKHILPILILLVMACGPRIRNEAVYRTEVTFVDMTITQQASTVREFLRSQACSCANNTWTPAACATAADNLATVNARWAWHKAMMLYNAGLGPDPGSTPAIPAVTCTVAQ